MKDTHTNPYREMTHNASVYPDPFIFLPERFLGPNAQPDPHPYVFGFGRRYVTNTFVLWFTKLP